MNAIAASALVAGLAKMRPHAVGNVAVRGLGAEVLDVPFALPEDPCAFDSLDEQPTERSLMCAWIHARMCPSPGAIPAHMDLRSTGTIPVRTARTDAVRSCE